MLEVVNFLINIAKLMNRCLKLEKSQLLINCLEEWSYKMTLELFKMVKMLNMWNLIRHFRELQNLMYFIMKKIQMMYMNNGKSIEIYLEYNNDLAFFLNKYFYIYVCF